jgi:hypothetical protein
MAKMSDKTKRAINKGRRKAGLKPIKFGAKKNNPHKKKNGLPVYQVPIGYKIGDRAAQVRLMKRYVRKLSKSKKDALFAKWQSELNE